MRVQHLNAGARGTLSLIEGDAERFDLLDELVDAFGERLLAYCILRTHVHVVAEGTALESAALLEGAIDRLARIAAERGREVPVLRGPAHAAEKSHAFEVGRSIRYVHRNALDVSGIERSFEYAWSSERDFLGLRLAPRVNVALAAEAMGGRGFAIAGGDLEPPPLYDLAPARFPTVHPAALLAAAADALALRPAAVVGSGRGDREVRARAAFLVLARLEGYSLAEAGDCWAARARPRSTLPPGPGPRSTTRPSGRSVRSRATTPSRVTSHARASRTFPRGGRSRRRGRRGSTASGPEPETQSPGPDLPSSPSISACASAIRRATVSRFRPRRSATSFCVSPPS